MTAGEERTIEVELKFRERDAERIRGTLRDLGGRPEGTVGQIDLYFAHPVRNFAITDEAFRIRTVGETGCVTYKGPLLDEQTKSREEIEIAFAGGAGDAARFRQVVERLGFTAVRSVQKERETWRLDWQQHAVEIAIDEVDGLGSFVELETAASPARFEQARSALLALAARLELQESERRSYLALLLADGGM